jgi:hypothetical protein
MIDFILSLFYFIVCHPVLFYFILFSYLTFPYFTLFYLTLFYFSFFSEITLFLFLDSVPKMCHLFPGPLVCPSVPPHIVTYIYIVCTLVS